MERRAFISMVGGFLTITPQATATSTEVTIQPQSNAQLLSIRTENSDFDTKIGVGICFKDPSCQYRRIGIVLDKDVPPEGISSLFRMLADAMDDPTHEAWIKGTKQLVPMNDKE